MTRSRTIAIVLALEALLVASAAGAQETSADTADGPPGGEVPCTPDDAGTAGPEPVTGRGGGRLERLFEARPPNAMAMEGAAADAEAALFMCEQVECECAEGMANVDGALVLSRSPSAECAEITCRCAEAGRPGVVVPPGVLDDAPLLPAPRPELRRERFEPGPVSGFPLPQGRAGALLEMGWPFVDLRFAYGVHDAVQLGIGYRGLYTQSFGGYGMLQLRLYHNPMRRAALSLVVMGGYSHVPGRGRDHDRITSHVGGDSGFGEISLAASAGRGRHWFIFHVGARLGWVRGQSQCEVDEWGWVESACTFRIFHDGHDGMLVTTFTEVGYAVRLGATATFFATTGVDAKTNSDAIAALPRARLGVMFDFGGGRSGGER